MQSAFRVGLPTTLLLITVSVLIATNNSTLLKTNAASHQPSGSSTAFILNANSPYASPQSLSTQKPLTSRSAVAKSSNDANHSRSIRYGHAPSKQPITPVGRMMLVLPKDGVERSPGGIFIPTEFRNKRKIGQVIAIPPGYSNEITGVKIPHEVVAGDWILYQNHDTETVKLDGADYNLLPIDSILAKVDPQAKTSELSVSALTPVGDLVLVKLLDTDEKSAAGLYIAKNVESTYSSNGEVVSLGFGRFDANGKRLPMEVGVGDKIRFSHMSSDESSPLAFDNSKYMFVHSRDILAKWK